MRRPRGICHAEGCDRLMKDHSTLDHLKCTFIIVKMIEKKHAERDRKRIEAWKSSQ